MLFDFLKDILYSKKGDLFLLPESEEEYNPYMINRWLSMFNPQIAQIINATSNILWEQLETKKDHYIFLVNIIPKQKFKKMNYIKKQTKKSQKDDNNWDTLHRIANHFEISVREVLMAMDSGVMSDNFINMFDNKHN